MMSFSARLALEREGAAAAAADDSGRHVVGDDSTLVSTRETDTVEATQKEYDMAKEQLRPPDAVKEQSEPTGRPTGSGGGGTHLFSNTGSGFVKQWLFVLTLVLHVATVAAGPTFGNDEIYNACNATFAGDGSKAYKKKGCEFYHQGYSGGDGYSCCSLAQCNGACVRFMCVFGGIVLALECVYRCC
jgi:hypothetical protein